MAPPGQDLLQDRRWEEAPTTHRGPASLCAESLCAGPPLHAISSPLSSTEPQDSPPKVKSRDLPYGLVFLL